jgi:hypothetical protein
MLGVRFDGIHSRRARNAITSAMMASAVTP